MTETSLEEDAPGPAPERALARRRASMGLTRRVQLALALCALVPVAVVAAARFAPPSPPAAPSPLPERDLSAARAELDALVATGQELQRARVDAARDALPRSLERAAAALMAHLRVARDARKKERDRKKRKSSSAPFDLDELRPVLAKIGVDDDGKRWLIRRDGTPLAPGPLPELPFAAAAPGDDEALALEATDADDGASIAARRCVAREGLCLVEVRHVPRARTEVAALRAALEWRPPPPAPTPVAAAPTWPLVAAGAAALLLLLLFGARVHAGLRVPLELVEQRLRALAAGHPSEGPRPSAPDELARIHDRVDELNATLGTLAAREQDSRDRDARLYALTDKLALVGQGELRERFPEVFETDDAPLRALAEAIAAAVADLERQLVRIRSHLSALEAPEPELARRVEAVAPIPTVIRELASRALAISKLDDTADRPRNELLRLAKAARLRADTADELVAALKQAARVEAPDALGALSSDLEHLQLDLSAARLVEALDDLSEDELTRRVAQVGQAPTPS